MHVLDTIALIKRPSPGTPVLSQQDVLSALMHLNRPSAPYRIVDGRSKKVDLIAEWRTDDPEWRQVFTNAGFLHRPDARLLKRYKKKTFRIYLRFDPKKHRVRAVDRLYIKFWLFYWIGFTGSIVWMRGQIYSLSFGKRYRFTETTSSGHIYNYRFVPQEIKKPLQDVVTSCGWIYKGVWLWKL